MRCFVASRLLSSHGVIHGFSTREGGVSKPPFDAMNLGRTVGDDPAAVEENHRRLAAAVGYGPEALAEASQVHGTACVDVDAFVEPDGRLDAPRVRRERADALVVRRPGLAVGVRTADCVPLLAWEPRSGAVAAIHAGWRGAVDGVVPEAIARLLALGGGAPEELVVAIGPHIRVASFEVGEEVVAAVERAMPADPRAEPLRHALVSRAYGVRPHVSLAALVTAQLRAAGVPSERIDDVGGDTCLERERFHSHRRDGARSGRQLSVIVAGRRGALGQSPS